MFQSILLGCRGVPVALVPLDKLRRNSVALWIFLFLFRIYFCFTFFLVRLTTFARFDTVPSTRTTTKTESDPNLLENISDSKRAGYRS